MIQNTPEVSVSTIIMYKCNMSVFAEMNNTNIVFLAAGLPTYTVQPTDVVLHVTKKLTSDIDISTFQTAFETSSSVPFLHVEL